MKYDLRQTNLPDVRIDGTLIVEHGSIRNSRGVRHRVYQLPDNRKVIHRESANDGWTMEVFVVSDEMHWKFLGDLLGWTNETKSLLRAMGYDPVITL